MTFTGRGVAMLLGICVALSRSALAQSHVQAEDGAHAVLPCKFDGAIAADDGISWERVVANKSKQQILSYFMTPTPTIPNVQWQGDLRKGDASVKISPVSYTDAGVYTCEAFFSDDNIKTIVLSVTAKATIEMTSTSTSTIVAGVACMIVVVGIMYLLMKRRRRNRNQGQISLPSSDPLTTQLHVAIIERQ